MSGIIETAKRLGELPGVSGCEGVVRDEIIALIKDNCESYEADALGNLLAFKKGEKEPAGRIMLCAHMDEVGLIVTRIEDNGLLCAAPVGALDGRVLFGKTVEVGPKRICGVIGGKATHHLTESEKQTVPDPDKLLIDIGADGRKQAEEHVSHGDRAVFCSPPADFGENHLLGKAFDDRAGCAILIELMRSSLPYDCHFAFTAQEETGSIGAITAAYAIEPDIAITVETTTAADIAGVPEGQQTCKLGGGAAVSFMDRGTLYDKAMYDLAFELAREKGIKVQPKTLIAGTTDSRSIQTAKSGARVLTVSTPCRYLHSQSLLINKDDVAEVCKLLAALVERLGAGV